MKREYYSSSISKFCIQQPEEIIGYLTTQNEFDIEKNQINAWEKEIEILQASLVNFQGDIFFEYSIPRMGKRIDVLLVIRNVIFIIEFKVGEKVFTMSALDQVMDYALDMKNFHETSHDLVIAPILISTEATRYSSSISYTPNNDKVLHPIKSNIISFPILINSVLDFAETEEINIENWKAGKYSPTPTIIEAALSLYNNHSVAEITRSDAEDLRKTTNTIDKIINDAKIKKEKVICFITGVPGAGKTLVGLNVATKHIDKDSGATSVFLSGNGPLVSILREALTRDRLEHEKALGQKVKKKDIESRVKLFIQNVHNFRDEYLKNDTSAPIDHVAIFDEAQRAWDKVQTANFMKRRKGISNFDISEPQFLISCLDRHKDWAVIVCLVGGGQEINMGEAGIQEWMHSISRAFTDWKVYLSNNLTDSEYSLSDSLTAIKAENIIRDSNLHLSISMRSYRAENLSKLVKCILDLEVDKAQIYYQEVCKKYPIVLTRDLSKAKNWLRNKARGTERYGIVVSSKAERLKSNAIFVKSPINPIHWFLNDKTDVRSSYYLEDVATEFDVQGLELDWTCVTWDADFRYSIIGWDTFAFKGKKWQRIIQDDRKKYLLNAYRVLLTRARQGMILVVPEGSTEDPTRKCEFYDSTFEYLKNIGLEII